jgi:hypothetical protein
MRRLFASATILAIFLTSVAASPAHAAADPCALDISGNVVNGFSPRGVSTCTALAIPDSATAIAVGAFFGHIAALETLTIGSGIETITSSAFYGAQSLRSLTIPNSVITIEFDAFYGTSSLETLTIGNSVTTIQDNAFYGAQSLRSLTIPNSVTTIGDNAFRDANNLETLIIGNSVTTIGDNAFAEANNLETLIIGNSVTTIGDDAFKEANLLTSLTIPNSVTTIGEDAFRGASALNTVTFLGQAPTSVDNDAFFNIKVGAKAIVTAANVASFGGAGSIWKRLIVEIARSDAPPSDDGAAAARAAAELREAKKRKARADLTNPAIALTVGAFSDAECNGVHGVNFADVSTEIQSLSLDSRIDIKEILKICRKYEVVDKVATSKPFHHAMLQEIGLIPLESKFKSQITVALRSLPGAEVSTYKQIEIAIANKVKAIQDLKSRLATTIARISGR